MHEEHPEIAARPLERSGHVSHLEEPAAFAGAIGAFLARIAR